MSEEYKEAEVRMARLVDDQGRVTFVARITQDGHFYYGVGADPKTAIEDAFNQMLPGMKKFEYHDQALWSPALKKLLDDIGAEEYDSSKQEQRKLT